MKILVLMTSLVIGAYVPDTFAAVEMGMGRGCDSLLITLKRRWIELQHHMEPLGSDLDRPDDEDFVCVDPNYLGQTVERRVATGADVRCFSPRLAGGLGICCDSRLAACAMLNPQLHQPQRLKERKEEEEPPRSLWVTPPSENDQWQSN